MAILRIASPLLAAGLLALALLPANGADETKKDKDKAKDKKKQVWTDPEDSSLPADFKFQGEYKGEGFGCQVIALDEGRFQAVVYPGGLPGDGWDGKNKILLDGKLADDKVTFEPTKGKRSYKAAGWQTFAATSKFPPIGQKNFGGTISGDTLAMETDDGKSPKLKKFKRQSKTLSAKPPEGAVVLFDGTNMDEWQGGKLDKKKKLFNTEGNDVRTKKTFNSYTAHLEFMTPFKPWARDQERGNSGFYQVDTYEVQVLDSFGLDGKMNEAGGIYKWRNSDVNACFPPLTWQTYDVIFTNAVKEGNKVVKKARITVRLNGILIHDDYELPGPNGGGRDDKLEGTPGPIKLQGHGNPVQYRNVWLVEKK